MLDLLEHNPPSLEMLLPRRNPVRFPSNVTKLLCRSIAYLVNTATKKFLSCCTQIILFSTREKIGEVVTTNLVESHLHV
jgi:hypothetical protein